MKKLWMGMASGQATTSNRFSEVTNEPMRTWSN